MWLWRSDRRRHFEGIETTNFLDCIGDCFINHEIRIQSLNNQDSMEDRRFFFSWLIYPKNPQGPSNGRVNEPVFTRGVLVFKIARPLRGQDY